MGVVIPFSASDHSGVLPKTWRVATVAVKRQAVRSHRDARDAKGDTPALRRTRECAGTQVARPSRYLRRRHRSEEHTSELQSRLHLVCRLLLEKKKKKQT